MKPKELLVRDLECPEWADEWLWARIVAEMGDQVIARVCGVSASVCPCCKAIHGVPVIEQEGAALRHLCQRLGTIVIEGPLAVTSGVSA